MELKLDKNLMEGGLV